MLKIGKINFVNLYPIFRCLEEDIAGNSTEKQYYEIIPGVPSHLNSLIREGKIDVSPSSSIEYLRRPELYDIVPGHSVSSFGPVKSIILFSKMDITKLEGTTVLASFQSETSAALLKIIFLEFYEINVNIETTGITLAEGLNTHPAYLLIGDNALYKLHCRAGISTEIFTYDLGALWYEHTGLPFVFALWISRKDCNQNLLSEFVLALNRAKNRSLNSLSEIAQGCPCSKIFSKDMLVSYWENISYDLTEKHMQGLQLFETYLKKHDVLCNCNTKVAF
ncbi:MAG: menaquinone biosynthesis protein [Nitrospirae bacterium YQR-1]